MQGNVSVTLRIAGMASDQLGAGSSLNGTYSPCTSASRSGHRDDWDDTRGSDGLSHSRDKR